jgi:hypothetical protein
MQLENYMRTNLGESVLCFTNGLVLVWWDGGGFCAWTAV